MTRLSCEDERMLLTHDLSAEAIIIGDKSSRTNRSGSDRNAQQCYENIKQVIQNSVMAVCVTNCWWKKKQLALAGILLKEATHTHPVPEELKATVARTLIRNAEV